jgi:nucleoside phosphorylase
MILILIPSHFEAKTLIAELAGRREFRVGEADCAEGEIGETAVTVGVIGMGPPHAALRARAVMEAVKQGAGSGEREAGNQLETSNSKLETLRGVILAGFAGALNPELKRGEIFVTAGENYLLPLLPEAERPRSALLATVDKIAGTAEAKKEMFESTGAWLCDMEQAHVAAVAQELGLPFVGVRIVSDEAHEDLPAETLGRSYDQETGTYTPWKLAGHLTRNPFRTVPLAAFVRLLPPVRNHMSRCLHTWLTQTGSRLFQ